MRGQKVVPCAGRGPFDSSCRKSCNKTSRTCGPKSRSRELRSSVTSSCVLDLKSWKDKMYHVWGGKNDDNITDNNNSIKNEKVSFKFVISLLPYPSSADRTVHSSSKTRCRRRSETYTFQAGSVWASSPGLAEKYLSRESSSPSPDITIIIMHRVL